MTNIHDQHGAAFRNVSAYVVLRGDKVVAKIAFKFGGAVTAYVHWLGIEMTKGQAGGGGYDRRSAAVAIAARKIDLYGNSAAHPLLYKFFDAASLDGGKRWDDAVRGAGFTVIQAV